MAAGETEAILQINKCDKIYQSEIWSIMVKWPDATNAEIMTQNMW